MLNKERQELIEDSGFQTGFSGTLGFQKDMMESAHGKNGRRRWPLGGARGYRGCSSSFCFIHYGSIQEYSLTKGPVAKQGKGEL